MWAARRATNSRSPSKLWAGPRGDADRATDLACEAAAQAADRLAWEQSLAWYRRALDQCELSDTPDDRRAKVLLAVGQALNRLGQAGAARAYLVDAAAEVALRTGDAVTLAEAAVAYGGMAGPHLEYGDIQGVELLRAALPLVPSDCLALKARVLARSAVWHRFDADSTAGESLAYEAIDLARRSGDPEALCSAILGAFFVMSDAAGVPL